MKKINCIAIDDEPLALGLIVSYINKTPFLELQGQFDNPLDAMEFLEDNPVDLLFLDIQMPDLTGIDFSKTIDKSTKFIFITAYQEYALEGFKVEALDYLMKPVSYEVFLNSAQRAKNHFEQLRKSEEAGVSLDMPDSSYFFVKADYKIQKFEYDDILYFEGLKDYVKLFLNSTENPVVFHATMKSIESKLPDNKFMRIHRSYIVNLDRVKTIEKHHIIFGDEQIPISDQYKPKFDEFVKNKFL